MERGPGGAGSGEMGSEYRPRRWWDLRLFTPGWSADQHPDLNETVPEGWRGLDMLAMACAALLVGLGLRTCALRTGPDPEPRSARVAVSAAVGTQARAIAVSRP